jgi:hypothetical protein
MMGLSHTLGEETLTFSEHSSRRVPRRQVQHRNECGASPTLNLHCKPLILHRDQVDGISITGDLPLLSLGRKIVLQPRHLLQITARGGSELEFTSIASTLTGLKVITSVRTLCHASHVSQVTTLNVSVGGVADIACEYVIQPLIIQPRLSSIFPTIATRYAQRVMAASLPAFKRALVCLPNQIGTFLHSFIPALSALSFQVLVNPNSGRKNAAIVWRSVEHLFVAADVACDVRESTHSNHLYDPGQVAQLLM